MGSIKIEGVEITPLKIISLEGGDVLHAMKDSDVGFNGFGEAYFSIVEYGTVKAWKRHRSMTSNLIVPAGVVRFVMFDDYRKKDKSNLFEEITLSKENYCRLTVPPMVWFGFKGKGKNLNLVLNIADIKHDPMESDHKNIEEIEFDWRK
jgi:dTDP-4-dehydrorhamnose 3,5-epimerase